MREQDALELAARVKAAAEWKPVGDDIEVFMEKTDRERAERQPVTARKCCRACIFMNPNDTCENFLAPGRQPKREEGEFIPIPRGMQDSLYCEAWIEVELGKLLLRGGGAGGIAYGRRHPRLEIPPKGAGDFAKYFATLSRAESKPKFSLFGLGSREPKWGDMDPGLKDILQTVERRGNDKMWSQYQGTLFLMGAPTYISPILDRLSQVPVSRIKDFLEYMIGVHGYHYSAMFGMAGTKGAEAFERIVKLLEQPTNPLHDLALKLLLAISKNSSNRPSNQEDPNLWREWAKKEYQFSWKVSWKT